MARSFTAGEARRLVLEYRKLINSLEYGANVAADLEEQIQPALEEYLAPAIAVYFPMSDRLTENVSELGAYIADKIETRDLIMESTVYTDKCLVYYDEGCDIVRIKLSMVVYSCNDLEELKSVLNVKDIELGKPFSIIYDVYTGPGLYMENKETYQVQRVVEP